MVSWDYQRSPAGALNLAQSGIDQGASEAEVLKGTGLKLAQLRDLSLLISGDQEMQVAFNLYELFGDQPGIGARAGSSLTVNQIGMCAYVMLASKNFREAIMVGLRYRKLTSTFCEIALREYPADNQFRIVFTTDHLPVQVRDLLAERDFVAIGNFLNVLVGSAESWPDVQITSAFTGERAKIVGQAFAPSTVVSGASKHQVTGGLELLDIQLPSTDAFTKQLFEVESERLLNARTRRTGVASQVRMAIVRQYAAATIDEVASELHVSQRTLRRQLAAEGTSFRQLRREVTETLAMELLVGARLSVAEVAGRLGYSDSVSFSHSFKGWTGFAPSHFAAAWTAHGIESQTK